MREHAAKPGFHQTEIGAFPRHWSVARLSSVLDFRNGVNADKDDYGSGVPFINVMEIIGRSHLVATDVPGRVRLPRAVVETYAVRKGDLVFNRTSETQEEVALSSTYVDDEPMVFGGFVIRGRPKSAEVDPAFLGYALRAPTVRRQVVAKGQGAIRANVGQADLGTVLVPLPPLPEQRAIAAALNDVDALLAKLDEGIAKKRDVKQAAMQQLLTGRRRLQGFRATWETKRLDDLGSFAKGAGILKDDVIADGLPCIRYGEIYTKHGNYIRAFVSRIPVNVAKTSKRLRRGDVIFAASGETAEEIGKCVAFLGAEEAYAGGDTIILSPKGHDSKFLGYLLNAPEVAAQKARMGQGDAVVHISARNLATLTVRMPPLDEQRAIAAVLSDMDDELDALVARREKTRALKQGMMQELLTGRVRLPGATQRG